MAAMKKTVRIAATAPQQKNVMPPPALPAAAGMWRRFASMMYEGILLFGVVFLASYLFDTLTQSRSGLTLRHGRQAVVFIAIGIYFVLCWRARGQTLPMKTWNIRLIDRDGRAPPLSRLIVRYILVWPLPLVFAQAIFAISQATGRPAIDLLVVFAPFTLFIWPWLDADRQFLHDRLLGTRLVDVPIPRKASA
jgi:uncharacterized RDD family membrane protein YckC